jgi:hypothetical protein
MTIDLPALFPANLAERLGRVTTLTFLSDKNAM